MVDCLPMSAPERRDLESLERVIEKGVATFVEVGNALCSIRDRRLYRAEFNTFEQYCLSKWCFTRTYAHRLIGAAEVVANLATRGVEPPANEAQARPLVGMDPEDAAEVLEEARESAAEEGRPVTAQDIDLAAVARKAGIDPASVAPDPPTPPREKALHKIIVAIGTVNRESGKLDPGEQEELHAWLEGKPDWLTK